MLRTEEEGKPEQERSLEEWDFGLDFIEEKQLLPWVNGRDSAIYRWPQALMEKSLRDLGQDGVLARVHEVWPLTLYDFILDGKGTWIAWYTRSGQDASRTNCCHGTLSLLDYQIG